MTQPDNLIAVANNIAAIFEADLDADAQSRYRSVAETPVMAAGRTAVRKGDLDNFYYTVQQPFEQVIEGLLATEIPGTAEEARFLFQNSRFVEAHFLSLIQQHDGSVCCYDKVSTVLGAILEYLRTGKEISFNYTQERTYQLPRRVFRDHASIMRFFLSLIPLFNGNANSYMQALLSLNRDLRE